MKRACAIVLVLLLTLSAVGCTGQNQQQDSVYKTNLMLDTIVQITLYDWEDSSTIDLAFDEIRRLESLLSVEQEGSDLYRLAQAAGKEWVEISSETEEVLRLSKEYYTLSQGHFDVTIGPLVDLWNIHNGEGHYPTQEELDAVKSAAEAEMDEAVKFADESPYPDPATVLDDMYVTDNERCVAR